MNPWLFIAVAVAGGLGAGLRWLLDVLLTRMIRHRFPWAIFAINVTGSLALGALVGSGPADPLLAIVGTGLLGGYTTFSTVAVESHLLAESGERRMAWGNVAGTLVSAVAAAGLGALLGSAVFG